MGTLEGWETKEEVIKPEIKEGVKVKRTGTDHGSMKVGDISVVCNRFGNGVSLEIDKHRGYEHDVKNLEKVC